MNDLTLDQITALQKQYGVNEIQEGLNSGEIWKREGEVGRLADCCLDSGLCMLPEHETRDFYGTRIPPRNILKAGTKGTLENCQAFWQKVEDGDYETIEQLESAFGKSSDDL